MNLRTLPALLALTSLLFLGGCRDDDGGGVGRGEEDTGLVDEPELIEEDAGVEAPLTPPGEQQLEIRGNGIDDDADGEIDEEA